MLVQQLIGNEGPLTALAKPAADLWIEENPKKEKKQTKKTQKQHVGGFTWVKNDKVFPNLVLIIKRINSLHGEWHELSEDIIVGQLDRSVASNLKHSLTKSCGLNINQYPVSRIIGKCI